MSDNVIFGIDFRKGREPLTDLTQMAADIVSQITEPAEDTADTAPAEMNPDSGECA